MKQFKVLARGLTTYNGTYSKYSRKASNILIRIYT